MTKGQLRADLNDQFPSLEASLSTTDPGRVQVTLRPEATPDEVSAVFQFVDDKLDLGVMLEVRTRIKRAPRFIDGVK